MKKYMGEIGLMLTAIIWGYGFVATYNSINSLSVFQTIFLRFLIASLIMSIIFFSKLKSIKVSSLKRGSLTGLTLFAGFVFQTIGRSYTSGSKNAFLTAFNVILVPFIAYFLFKRRPSRNETLGAVLSLLGIALISFNFDFSINFGDVLTLLCAVMFALQITLTDIFVEKEDPVLFTLIQMAFCAMAGFIVMLLFDSNIKITSVSNLYPVIYLGVFSTMLAFILQTICQKYVNETKSAVLLSTESLWGSLFSVMFLGEVASIKIIIGGLIMFLAVILSTVRWNRAEKNDVKKS